MRLLSAFLVLTFALKLEAEEFPIGLNSEFEPIFATIESAEIFNPAREKVHVLFIENEPSSDFDPDEILVSRVKFPAKAGFPPTGKFYTTEAQYLWRWIHAVGPDAVVTDNASLREALKDSVPAFSKATDLPATISASPLRMELGKRSKRSALEIAESVGNHYGHKFARVSYLPALAMVGRNRLAELKGESISDELKEIALKTPIPEKLSGPAVAGNLIFAELGLEKQVISAAKSGIKNPGDNQMSDSVFMICPMLAAAGRIAGEEKYFEACMSHFEKMKTLCLRDDGLYRHSPLDEAAWGRGNGFPALGLAWTLSEMPKSFSGHETLKQELKNHLNALAKHQDVSGMWHQVVDQPGSYREFTSTCMITFAMLRGMREGWLDRETFLPLTERSWTAIKQRISLDGKSFTDACTGTGKQKSLKDYFLRTAIFGPDDRSGAMALMVATEIEYWKRDQEN